MKIQYQSPSKINFNFSDEPIIFFDLIPLFSKEGLGEIWQNLFLKKLRYFSSAFISSQALSYRAVLFAVSIPIQFGTQ